MQFYAWRAEHVQSHIRTAWIPVQLVIARQLYWQLPGVQCEPRQHRMLTCVFLDIWKRGEKRNSSSLFCFHQWVFGLWRRACCQWHDTVSCLCASFLFSYSTIELTQSIKMVRGRIVQQCCWLTSTCRSGAGFSLLIAKETKSLVLVHPGA